ncbi:MarR family transcriptional regulator [Peptostreptococcus russellii]|uniref:MarR family winged helix-turn-helix transcriptional regulator n=1 Tax=Peptostreptococcus russellii TaxID=215200 RepID=UPI001625A9DB|nr:MarR family transcriptional regulator [Peptostreptococcus russellii]MBC2577300.1 MarR family transcriptional regulator [Peptostreptococcus russellii]
MQKSVDTTISFLVKSLPRLYNDFYLEYIKSFIQGKNINKNQVRALTFIKNYGSISMSELCNMLNIEKGSLTSMIDDLEKKKYVERMKDKKDRRKYNIVLTKDGDKMACEFLEHLKINLHDKIERIEKDNLGKFFESMNEIIKTMESIDD